MTNAGAAPVTLTGDKMDDSTFDLNVAVPMVGVSSIAPGESVVSVEDKYPAVTPELDPLNPYP